MLVSRKALSLSLTLLVSLAPLGHADTGTPSASPSPTPAATNDSSAKLYPYLQPDEKTCPQIVEADNTGGYLFSKDCKTLFVKPPAVGQFTVSDVTPSVTVSQCQAYLKRAATVSKMQDEQSVLFDKAAAADPNDPNTAKIQAQIDTLTAEMKSAMTLYSGIWAGTAEISLNSGFNQDFINKWIVSNVATIQSTGLRVMPAPISQSFYSITQRQAADTDTNPAVISISMPGLPAPVGVNSVIGGEAMGGQVVLGMAGACSIADLTQPNAPLQIRSSGLKSYLLTTRTYEIPVSSDVGYDAVLNVTNAINVVGSSMVTKKQFSADDVANLFINGPLSSSMTFNAYDPEMQQESDEKWHAYEDQLELGVATELAQRLLTFMVTNGTAVEQDAATPVTPVDGGLTNQTEHHNVCHSDGGISSIWGGHHCGDETYTIPVWNDGIATKLVQLHDTTQYTVEDHVSAEHTNYRPGTQNF